MTLLGLAVGLLPAQARADGDPASDVLATQPLFLPQDAAVSTTQQAQLIALLEQAQHSDYRIRVALIASSNDLGSVTELWRQPQNYAQFLGQELSLVYKGPLLVIMPAGFGLYGFDRPTASEQSALAGIRPAGANASLVSAGLLAIQRLASVSGHTLAIPSATPFAPGSSGSSDTYSWLAFALGCTLIATAWTASLRARPLRSRSRNTPAA